MGGLLGHRFYLRGKQNKYLRVPWVCVGVQCVTDFFPLPIEACAAIAACPSRPTRPTCAWAACERVWTSPRASPSSSPSASASSAKGGHLHPDLQRRHPSGAKQTSRGAVVSLLLVLSPAVVCFHQVWYSLEGICWSLAPVWRWYCSCRVSFPF